MSLFLAPLGHTPHCHNTICSRGDGRVSTASPSALPVCDPALGRQQLLPPTAHQQELYLGQVNAVPWLTTTRITPPTQSGPGAFQVYLAENWTLLWGLAGSPKAIPPSQNASFSLPFHPSSTTAAQEDTAGRRARSKHCPMLNTSDTSDPDTAPISWHPGPAESPSKAFQARESRKGSKRVLKEIFSKCKSHLSASWDVELRQIWRQRTSLYLALREFLIHSRLWSALESCVSFQNLCHLTGKVSTAW